MNRNIHLLYTMMFIYSSKEMLMRHREWQEEYNKFQNQERKV